MGTHIHHRAWSICTRLLGADNFCREKFISEAAWLPISGWDASCHGNRGKQRLRHEGLFVGTSRTRAENWDAAEVWAERISHECVSNYHSEADKGFHNNEQKQSSLLRWRWHCVRVNPVFHAERKLEINVQRCKLITSQKPKNVLLITKSFFSRFKLPFTTCDSDDQNVQIWFLEMMS